MAFRALSEDMLVSPQIAAGDLDEAKRLGVTTIINNRPDGEEPDQPDSAVMEAAAQERGLSYHWIPMVPGALSADTIAAFGDALATSSGKTLAYCRTGTRSASLWALSQKGKQPADTLLKAAQKAGYDLSALGGLLRG